MSITSKPLSAPNFCFICKHSNDVEYWDSHRYFDPPLPLPEVGKKYVCVDCIRSAANEFGFVTPEAANELKERNASLETEIKDVRLQADFVKTIIDTANILAAGHPGQAAGIKPPRIESIPDTAKVTDEKTTKK